MKTYSISYKFVTSAGMTAYTSVFVEANSEVEAKALAFEKMKKRDPKGRDFEITSISVLS